MGGGAGGVELTLSAHYRLHRLLKDKGLDTNWLQFELLSNSEEILSSHPPRCRAKFKRILEHRGIKVRTGNRVQRIEPAEWS